MKSHLLAAALLLSASAADAKTLTGEDYLTPRFSAGETYGNVFSILSSIKADGYDEHASRNGGSGDYSMLAGSPTAWHFTTSWRYDGRPVGSDEAELHDGGRTYCSVKKGAKAQCQPYLEASGLAYNPALWGIAPGRLSVGMHWTVDLPQAWELGGSHGTETVTVIRLDPLTCSATLLREGTATGFFSEGDSNTVQLSRSGQTESFDVTPGTSHWKGYTTFVKGLIFSDELLVTRSEILHGKDGKTINASTRRIMLLNAAPYPTL